MPSPPPGGTLLEGLRRAVGDSHVLTAPADRAGYETDWTRRFSGEALAVVRPADAVEVQAVVALCAAHRTPVVPQGGNTGLVGGGVPRGGEVLLSLRRLDHIGEVDVDTPSVVVGAGATLAAVEGAVARAGLSVGVDLAARDSATIGGMVATNAGGVHVVANGTMRQRVLGLEAVTADGHVIRRLPGLVKDNTGYDWPRLLAGSEGTLAVITAVALHLVDRPRRRTVVLVGCTGPDDALAVTAAARRLGGLHAAEVMQARGVARVGRVVGLPPPLPDDPPWLVLLELLGDLDDEALAAVIGERPGTVSLDDADARRLWRYRESHTEAIAPRGVATKMDCTIPPARLGAVAAQLADVVPDAILFGHLAEGTIHVNVVDAAPEVEGQVLGAVADVGGSIASEHGVGIAKAPHLGLTRSAAEIAVMTAIKQALDPDGILNPGVILTPGTMRPTGPARRR